MGFDWGGFQDDGFYKRLQEIALQDRQMMEDSLKNMERKREREQLLDGALTGIRDNTEYLKRLEELSRIADAAQLRASLAQKAAESAEKDAKDAKRSARISNWISFGSMLIALAALLRDFLS